MITTIGQIQQNLECGKFYRTIDPTYSTYKNKKETKGREPVYLRKLTDICPPNAMCVPTGLNKSSINKNL